MECRFEMGKKKHLLGGNNYFAGEGTYRQYQKDFALGKLTISTACVVFSVKSLL